MHKKLLVTTYFVIAALLQTLAGNFPLSFFAFPLNVIIAVIWIYSLWRLYKEGNKLADNPFSVIFPDKCSIDPIINRWQSGYRLVSSVIGSRSRFHSRGFSFVGML